jgi:hypothetical protein
MKVEFFLLVVFTAFVVFNVVVFLFFRFFVKNEPSVSKNDRRKKREMEPAHALDRQAEEFDVPDSP